MHDIMPSNSAVVVGTVLNFFAVKTEGRYVRQYLVVRRGVNFHGIILV